MKKTDRFGVIQDFLIDPESSTGYSITFLTDGELYKYESTEELYKSQFLPEYTFPLITETPHLAVFNDDGVCCAVERFVPGVTVNGTYSFGEPKTSGYIASIRDGKIVLNADHIKRELDNGCLRYYGAYHHGRMEAVIGEDKVLELSDDAVIYCMDFVGGATKHVLKDMDYLADVLNNRKNCYWLSLYDLYGEDGKIDCVCMFMHAPKNPDGKGGDMLKAGLTMEQRRSEAFTKKPEV